MTFTRFDAVPTMTLGVIVTGEKSPVMHWCHSSNSSIFNNLCFSMTLMTPDKEKLVYRGNRGNKVCICKIKIYCVYIGGDKKASCHVTSCHTPAFQPYRKGGAA